MISQFVLGVLASVLAAALVAVAVFVYRKRINVKLQAWILTRRGIGIDSVYPSREAAQSEIKALLSGTHNLRYLGIQGLSLITSREILFSDLATSLSRNITGRISAKFLLLNPGSDFVETRATEIGRPASDLREGIQRSLSDLRSFAATAPHVNCEVRVTDSIPIWSILLTDAGGLVSFYLRDVRGPQSLSIKLQSNSALFSSWSRYFDYLWEQSNQATNK